MPTELLGTTLLVRHQEHAVQDGLRARDPRQAGLRACDLPAPRDDGKFEAPTLGRRDHAPDPKDLNQQIDRRALFLGAERKLVLEIVW